MKLLNLGQACLLATMIGSPVAVFAETAPATTDTSTTGTSAEQMQPSADANASGMTTQMTQEDQTIMAEVNKILTDGGLTGVEASVSAGVVTLKGPLPEDKAKAVTGAISKIPGVNSVNTGEANMPGGMDKMDATKDMQPMAPTTTPETPAQQ